MVDIEVPDFAWHWARRIGHTLGMSPDEVLSRALNHYLDKYDNGTLTDADR